MSGIHVIAPGMLTTVQDLGREGFGPMGVSPSGAADAVALRVGNRLVGNAEGAAGLEMTLVGGVFLFPEGGVIALTGSDFGASVAEARVEMWASVELRAGETLRVAATKAGARCYLCVRGGIAVEAFLGSASTHLLSGLGGFEGRALRKGDLLRVYDTERLWVQRKLTAQALQNLSPRKVLRVTAGVQALAFSDVARELFFGGVYRVREDSNRTGLRLEGPSVAAPEGGEMITEGIALGAVQVPESGQPIISFVEQQTTGGYPVIANVISVDLSSVGQLRPRDEARFELVEMEVARELLLEQEKLLATDGIFQ